MGLRAVEPAMPTRPVVVACSDAGSVEQWNGDGVQILPHLTEIRRTGHLVAPHEPKPVADGQERVRDDETVMESGWSRVVSSATSRRFILTPTREHTHTLTHVHTL